MWKEYENGSSIGKVGSEKGIIVLDCEHDEGMRITLEKCESYFTITYGLYGNMVDTLFGTEDEMKKTFEGLKIELEYYKYIPNSQDFEELSAWCGDLYNRRLNSAPKPRNKSKDAFSELREFSLNHFMIDMFPELKNDFIDYSGEDGYFYGTYCTYPDLLKPLILKAINENNDDILRRFSNLLEDISFSNDEFIDNFFYVGILEDICFFSEEERIILSKYFKENTLEKFNKYYSGLIESGYIKKA